jgi:hypothetical protein
MTIPTVVGQPLIRIVDGAAAQAGKLCNDRPGGGESIEQPVHHLTPDGPTSAVRLSATAPTIR